MGDLAWMGKTKDEKQNKIKKCCPATDDGNIAGPSSQMQKVFLRFRFYATRGFLLVDVVCGAPMCFPISGIGQTGFVIRGFSRVAPPPLSPQFNVDKSRKLDLQSSGCLEASPDHPSRKSRRLPQQH